MRRITAKHKTFPVQFFLSPGLGRISEVSVRGPGPGVPKFICTCPGYRVRRECKHTAWVREHLLGRDGLRLRFSETATTVMQEHDEDQAVSPETFRKWLLRLGEVQVL